MVPRRDSLIFMCLAECRNGTRTKSPFFLSNPVKGKQNIVLGNFHRPLLRTVPDLPAERGFVCQLRIDVPKRIDGGIRVNRHTFEPASPLRGKAVIGAAVDLFISAMGFAPCLNAFLAASLVMDSRDEQHRQVFCVGRLPFGACVFYPVFLHCVIAEGYILFHDDAPPFSCSADSGSAWTSSRRYA